ncbi:MAG TPA: hypothetical protein VHM47_08800 [Actinomycetota bacterium]|nr:hypothetical protein [Actinomycetota bacterium]
MRDGRHIDRILALPPCRRHVLTEVEHLEPGGSEHGADHVLAEVVQVALHRREDDQLPDLRVLRRCEQNGLDDRVALLEDLRRRDDLREEHLSALPHLAEREHRLRHPGLEDDGGIHPRVGQPPGGRDGDVPVGGDERATELVEVLFHRPVPSRPRT